MIRKPRIPAPEKRYDENNESQFRREIGLTLDQLIGVATRAETQSSFYSKAEIDAMLEGYYTSTEVDALLDGYYTKTQIDSMLDLLAPLASPALTGSPTAPTQSPGDNSTKIATTAYVDAAAFIAPSAADVTAGEFPDALYTFAGDVSISPTGVFSAGGVVAADYVSTTRFQTDSVDTSVSGTLGTVIGKMPIHDFFGVPIGYVPVYDSIT